MSLKDAVLLAVAMTHRSRGGLNCVARIECIVMPVVSFVTTLVFTGREPVQLTQ